MKTASTSHLVFFVGVLAFPACPLAQHGTADNGYFPAAYQGDTWTGVVSMTDPATREITLLHTQKQKTAVFQGVLSKSFRVPSSGEKQTQQIVAQGIAIGSHLRVYYIPDQTSDQLGTTAPFKAFNNHFLGESRDTKPRFNLIFIVEFLPDENESRTGTVVATSDATREITLAVTDGSKTASFTGVVIQGYQARMRDGSLRDLVVSQIPTGAKLAVHYFDEMTGSDRKTGEVHRIYRIQFLALPQTP
jgi:hypothetical protein